MMMRARADDAMIRVIFQCVQKVSSFFPLRVRAPVFFIYAADGGRHAAVTIDDYAFFIFFFFDFNMRLCFTDLR